MLAGVSTRRYARTGEPVGTEVDERARPALNLDPPFSRLVKDQLVRAAELG